MKNLVIILMFTFSTSAFAGLKQELQQIADEANVGNGSAEVSSYNLKKFNFEKAVEKKREGIINLYADSDIKCGPYKTTKDRRETLKAIADLDIDEATVAKLTELYNNKKIAKMFSITTNNEIECSNMWAVVYTTDGSVLEINYGMND